MKRYINVTGRIEVEARDRHTNQVLWTYKDITGIDHDKYFFYLYTDVLKGPIKVSKGSYRLGVRGEV